MFLFNSNVVTRNIDFPLSTAVWLSQYSGQCASLKRFLKLNTGGFLYSRSYRFRLNVFFLSSLSPRNTCFLELRLRFVLLYFLFSAGFLGKRKAHNTRFPVRPRGATIAGDFLLPLFPLEWAALKRATFLYPPPSPAFQTGVPESITIRSLKNSPARGLRDVLCQGCAPVWHPVCLNDSC